MTPSDVRSRSAAIDVTREARGKTVGDGLELAYGYWPGRGAPIIGIHGITASYLNYVGIAARLAGRRPLLAFDLRGRGDSDKPDGPTGMVQHARDVACAMQAFGVGPCVVVGHSMGAFVATALASEFPDLVAGLVLLDGGYLPDLPAGVDLNQVLDAALAPQLARLRQTFPSYESYLELWRGLPVFPADSWGPWVEEYLRYDLGGEPPNLKPKASEAAVRADFFDMAQRPEIEARLKAVKAPAMAIRAERGLLPDQPPLVSDQIMAGMRALLPQVEEHLIPTTTHYTVAVAERGASAVADLLVDFAGRCEA